MADLEIIQNKIYEIRGSRVMLDFDLAILYQTTTSLLKRAVRRNIDRFPSDFMFQLSKEEANSLSSIGVYQFGTPQYNYSAYLPFAFTEQGIAMISSVLKSDTAIKVNISIIRAFVQMRQFLVQNRDIILSIEELRKRVTILEESGEDTLVSLNELSEDSRREMDDIYIALAELAKSKNEVKRLNPIGFVKNNDQ